MKLGITPLRRHNFVLTKPAAKLVTQPDMKEKLLKLDEPASEELFTKTMDCIRETLKYGQVEPGTFKTFDHNTCSFPSFEGDIARKQEKEVKKPDLQILVKTYARPSLVKNNGDDLRACLLPGQKCSECNESRGDRDVTRPQPSLSALAAPTAEPDHTINIQYLTPDIYRQPSASRARSPLPLKSRASEGRTKISTEPDSRAPLPAVHSRKTTGIKQIISCGVVTKNTKSMTKHASVSRSKYKTDEIDTWRNARVTGSLSPVRSPLPRIECPLNDLPMQMLRSLDETGRFIPTTSNCHGKGKMQHFQGIVCDTGNMLQTKAASSSTVMPAPLPVSVPASVLRTNSPSKQRMPVQMQMQTTLSLGVFTPFS